MARIEMVAAQYMIVHTKCRRGISTTQRARKPQQYVNEQTKLTAVSAYSLALHSTAAGIAASREDGPSRQPRHDVMT